MPDLLVHVRLRSTLGGMYRQGRNFGAAQADLERRYAAVAVDTRDSRPLADRRMLGPASPPAVDARRPSQTWHHVKTAAWFVTHRSGLGGRVWQVGWHVGHRFG